VFRLCQLLLPCPCGWGTIETKFSKFVKDELENSDNNLEPYSMTSSDLIGKLIADRYLVLDILGEGSSGATYRAKDKQTGQSVALKALSLRRMVDWKALELFEREAQVLAQLEHSAIPRYLAHFHTDTQQDRAFYLVQQIAEGRSLADLVQTGWRITETEVRQIAEQVLNILIYLHSLTPPVIHRDLKPQNLIRQANRQICLVDFGAVQHTYYNTLMRGSTVAGTFGYMAPEQFRGQAVPATDLYSLGATLLFLLTRRSPAELPTDRLKLDFRSRIQVSDTFADWLECLLEPELSDRFSSAQVALAALRTNRSIAKPHQPQGWKMGMGVGVAMLVAIGGLSYFKYPVLSAIGFTPRPMYEGIMHGDYDTVKYYLDQGVSANAREYQNHSPLHWAVTNNRVEIVKLLIERGADVRAKYDDDEHTVLHMAMLHPSKELAQVLIEHGANINAKDTFGYTPLHIALLQQSAPYQRSPHSYFGLAGKQEQVSIELLEYLLQQGADVNARSETGMTAIQIAQNKSPEAARLLQSYGAKQ
jgi:hypothetical protein